MSPGKKVLLVGIFIVLVIGLSAPWQKVSEPLFLGFLPAPIFYLIIVHILFVCLIGYLAFFTKMHGRIEDEEKFLAETKSQEVSQ
ncbi:MAG: hypothetical protein JRJ59_10220 [Deltaproteobacteria bacterium]|nr:hypothetical protein [Deltaproteobacteria bacterium]